MGKHLIRFDSREQAREFQRIGQILSAQGHYDSNKPKSIRLDAGETAIFQRQLESIKVQIIEAEYPHLKARELIPVEPGVDPGADTFTWRFWDRLGTAKMIVNYADDLPRIDMFGSENKTAIETIGISFAYSTQDVRAAAKANVPLQARKALYAKEAAERKLEHIASGGDTTRNVPGVLKNANVPIISAGINGNWTPGGATAAQMYSDAHALAFTVWSQTLQIHEPDTMVLDSTPYQTFASTPYSTLNGESVMQVFLKSTPFIKQIIPWVECAKKAANNTSSRAWVYEKTPLNLALVIALEFQALPPQMQGLEFAIPCEMRTGGAVYYRPLSAVYCDVL